MDICPNCNKEFKRHYVTGGQRQVYCSKKCRYASSYIQKTCLTCGKLFKTNVLSTRKDYCSLACIARSPCQLCGKIITGRATFQSRARRFCSRKCAAIVNNSLTSKIKYTVIGFANTIHKKGKLICERCGEDNIATLITHHIDHNRENNDPENFETLCANCHAIEHWQNSDKRKKDVVIAELLAKHNPNFQSPVYETISLKKRKPLTWPDGTPFPNNWP